MLLSTLTSQLEWKISILVKLAHASHMFLVDRAKKRMIDRIVRCCLFGMGNGDRSFRVLSGRNQRQETQDLIRNKRHEHRASYSGQGRVPSR